MDRHLCVANSASNVHCEGLGGRVERKIVHTIFAAYRAYKFESEFILESMTSDTLFIVT